MTRTVIRCGLLYDGTPAPPREDVTLLARATLESR